MSMEQRVSTICKQYAYMHSDVTIYKFLYHDIIVQFSDAHSHSSSYHHISITLLYCITTFYITICHVHHDNRGISSPH